MTKYHDHKPDLSILAGEHHLRAPLLIGVAMIVQHPAWFR